MLHVPFQERRAAVLKECRTVSFDRGRFVIAMMSDLCGILWQLEWVRAAEQLLGLSTPEAVEDEGKVTAHWCRIRAALMTQESLGLARRLSQWASETTGSPRWAACTEIGQLQPLLTADHRTALHTLLEQSQPDFIADEVQSLFHLLKSLSTPATNAKSPPVDKCLRPPPPCSSVPAGEASRIVSTPDGNYRLVLLSDGSAFPSDVFIEPAEQPGNLP